VLDLAFSNIFPTMEHRAFTRIQENQLKRISVQVISSNHAVFLRTLVLGSVNGK